MFPERSSSCQVRAGHPDNTQRRAAPPRVSHAIMAPTKPLAVLALCVSGAAALVRIRGARSGNATSNARAAVAALPPRLLPPLSSGRR